MTKYAQEGDAIQGDSLYCTFKERPSYTQNEDTREMIIGIKGNPATATIYQRWTYVKKS